MGLTDEEMLSILRRIREQRWESVGSETDDEALTWAIICVKHKMRHGTWIDCGESLVPKVKCSVCGKISLAELGEPVFCQWCGSRNGRRKDESEKV